jgi:ribosome recycling factor
MPEPHRRAMLRAMREDRPNWEGARTGLRESRVRLAEALVAEPFDPTAVAAVLAAERALLGALAERGGAILVAAVERMTQEERRAYAAALMEERRRDGRPPR